MPDFGPQAGYIYAAFGIAALMLGAMIVSAVVGRAAARRRLASLEAPERM